MKELTPFESFNLKQSILIDRVVETIKGLTRGVYLHGRGGTGKTHTVERTLREYLDDNEWVVFRGKVTAGGIRTFIEECETAGVQVILFDDVAAILKNQDAIAIIQAAWDGKIISYARQGQHHSFSYSGGIIFISNFPLSEDAASGSLKSRGRSLEFNPTNDEMAAFMRFLAQTQKPHKGMTREECSEVVEYLISESGRLGTLLDLRLMRKSYADYFGSKQGIYLNTWQGLIQSEMLQAMIAVKNKEKPISKQEEIKREREVVRQILKEVPHDRKAQIKLYLERNPNGTERTFDRRKNDIKRGL